MAIHKYSGYYGIDLGTTNSVISALDKNGVPYVIPNKDGELLTPSFIRFYKNNKGQVSYQIGAKAKKAILKPKTKDEVVLFSYKTKMGEEGEKGVVGKVFGKELRSEQCSSLALKYLRESIEKEFPNTPIKRVVVTVPAYFETKQKEATKAIALKVFNTDKDRQEKKITKIDIISEPVATILSFSGLTETDFNEPKSVLVYDLGGGTFDISLALVYKKMNLKDNSEELCYMTLEESGNKALGGDDIDKALFFYAKKELINEGVDPNLIDENRDYIVQLLEQVKIALCEKMKTSKSNNISETATINLNNTFYSVKITKSIMKELISPIVNITLENVHEVMARVNSEEGNEIDALLLVGGSTKNKIIYDELKKEFPMLNIYANLVDPDKAISTGAAEMCKLLADNKDNNIASILTRDIGILQCTGEIWKYFKRGTQLPAKITKEFSNSEDGKAIRLEVYEGNVKRFDEPGANKLGTLYLDIPKDAKAETYSVAVTLEVLKDYTTKVQTLDKLNGIKILTIKRNEEVKEVEVNSITDELSEENSEKSKEKPKTPTKKKQKIKEKSSISWGNS